MRYFEKKKDAAGCRTTAELFENIPRTDAVSLYNAACFRAISAAVIRATDKSPAGARQADEEADRAMAWLEKAVGREGKTQLPMGTLRISPGPRPGRFPEIGCGFGGRETLM